eukprot:1150497-Pelagomonas_calceolata.AAC.9
MVEEDGYGNKDDMEEGKQRGEQEDGNKQLKQVMVEERKGGQEQPAGESIQEQQQHAGQTQVEPLASKQRHLSMVERFKAQRALTLLAIHRTYYSNKRRHFNCNA